MTPGASLPRAKSPPPCAMAQDSNPTFQQSAFPVRKAGPDAYFLWNVAPPSLPTDIVSFFAFRPASVSGAMS